MLYLWGGNNIQVTNNLFDLTALDPKLASLPNAIFAVGSDLSFIWTMNGLLISGNTFKGPSGWSGDGLFNSATIVLDGISSSNPATSAVIQNVQIVNNTITHSQNSVSVPGVGGYTSSLGSGVSSHGGMGSIANVTIQGNTFSKIACYGVLLDAVNGAVIRGNTLTDSQGNGFGLGTHCTAQMIIDGNQLGQIGTATGLLNQILVNLGITTNAAFDVQAGSSVSPLQLTNNNMTGNANDLSYFWYSSVPLSQSNISGNTDPAALLPNFP